MSDKRKFNFHTRVCLYIIKSSNRFRIPRGIFFQALVDSWHRRRRAHFALVFVQLKSFELFTRHAFQHPCPNHSYINHWISSISRANGNEDSHTHEDTHACGDKRISDSRKKKAEKLVRRIRDKILAGLASIRFLLEDYILTQRHCKWLIYRQLSLLSLI